MFQVVFTKGPHLQVKVHAEVVHPKTGGNETTNIFHFTFTTSEGVDVQTVMPKSYAGKNETHDVHVSYFKTKGYFVMTHTVCKMECICKIP